APLGNNTDFDLVVNDSGGIFDLFDGRIGEGAKGSVFSGGVLRVHGGIISPEENATGVAVSGAMTTIYGGTIGNMTLDLTIDNDDVKTVMYGGTILSADTASRHGEFDLLGGTIYGSIRGDSTVLNAQGGTAFGADAG